MGRHGVRMARLAERVAARLGFDDAECRELRRAGLLHHIGKLLVPIEILEKPATLTDEERAIIQNHPQIGADILRRSRILAGLAPLIEAQAESLDGTGAFPTFADERTALAARILAVCDRYEAMTSRRPYRPPLARAEVWQLLEEAATEPLAKQALSALRVVAEPN
jgi:putative nucleotidyltransferase with HDIG domain